MEEKKIKTKLIAQGKEKAEKIKEKVKQVEEKATSIRAAKGGVRLPNRIKLLISIVNYKDEIRLKEIIDEVSVALSFTFAGTGTARSQMLDYLGIGETEKAVVFSLFPESDEEIIIREIRSKMSLYLVGRGISFTVPLTGISEIVANGIASASAEKTVDGRKIMNSTNRKYDLIVASVEPNRMDEAMEAARNAGAAGGTIIRARSLDNAKAEQFIGISLMEEREILLILTKKESKIAIMEALSEKVGLKTDASGVIFSLPVDRTAGISVADEEAQEHGEDTEETDKE